MTDESNSKEARPEEIIVELWRRIRELREEGKSPGKIILSPEDYRRVQAWHLALGELPDPSRDYITKHTIFNVPVYVEAESEPNVTE